MRIPLLPGCKRTPLPQLLSVEPEHDGAWQADGDGQERQQRVAPAEAEAVVQAGREQRKPEPGERPEHGGGADGAGGVARVRVDQVRLDALEADDGARGEQGRANVGPDPVRLVLGRPPVDEQADGHEHGAGDHHGHAVLGPAGPAVARLEPGVHAVLQRRAHLRAQEEAHAQRDVVEAADAEALAVALGRGRRPQAGERDEHDVHEAVEEHHVEGEDLQDDLGAQQAKGPHKGDAQRLGQGPVGVVERRVEVVVARLLDELPLLPGEQDRHVGLAQEDDARDLNGGVCDRGRVKCPSPCRVLGDIGTD